MKLCICLSDRRIIMFNFFFQAEDGIRDYKVTGVQTCALPISGLLTTLQDHGRHGLQHLGLCPGGAMDPVALALANALVGNEAGEAALEITVIGPELLFE